MSFFSDVKNFFLPDEATARQRRLDVFGTDSKAVAGTVIVGAAAAAITAPIIISESGGLSTVLQSAGKALAGTSTTTKVGLAIAAPLVVGTVVRDPLTITKAPSAVANLEGNLFNLAANPTLENAKKIVKENPLLTGGVAAALLGTSVVGASNALLNYENTQAVKKNTAATLASASISGAPEANLLPATTPTTNVSTTPVTPATQVMPTSAQSVGTTRRRRSAKKPVQPNVRVAIYNQQINKGGRASLY